MPGLGPLLGRFIPKGRQEQLLHVDQSAFSGRDRHAQLVSRGVHALGKGCSVGLELRLQTHSDIVIDDEVQRASADAEN